MNGVLPEPVDCGLQYKDKRVLVTGGLGFIGSNLAIRLIQVGANVMIVDCSIAGCGANPYNIASVESKVSVIACDVGDAEKFSRELQGIEVIFNLAGEISHSRSMEQPERDLQLNTVSQLRFLLACRAHCPKARIVYAGTRQVYGPPEYLPVDEAHPIQPVDFNGVHKFAATQYHLLLARRGDLDCVVLRLSNVYGPRMALHLSHQGFLAVYLRQALNGEPMLVYGDGRQLRDPVHVDDVVTAFLRAGAAPKLRSRVFNIGGSQAFKVSEIASIVARRGGGSTVSRTPFPEGLRRMDVGSYRSNTARAGHEFEWTPRILFEEGIGSTLAYYRAHRDHYLGLIEPSVRPPTAATESRRASAS